MGPVARSGLPSRSLRVWASAESETLPLEEAAWKKAAADEPAKANPPAAAWAPTRLLAGAREREM